MSDNQSSSQTVSSEQLSKNKLQDFKQQDFLSKFEGSWLQKRKGIGIKLKSSKNGDFYIRFSSLTHISIIVFNQLVDWGGRATRRIISYFNLSLCVMLVSVSISNQS